MKSFLKLIVFYCCTVFVGYVYALSSIQVDNTNIYAKTPFSLTIKSSSSSVLSQAVLKTLKKQFNIVGQSSGQMVRSFNGKTTKQTQWVFNLIARQLPPKSSTMKLAIPAFSIGSDKTKPVNLILHPAASKVHVGINDQVFFKATLSPAAGYVGQQYLLTLSVYRTPGIIPRMQQMAVSPFKIKKATKEQLPSEPPTMTRIKGQLYQVLSQRFVVYPERAGTLDVPSAVFGADIIKLPSAQTRGQLFSSVFDSPFSADVKAIRLASNAISFKVKAKPVSQGLWLPAQKLTLSVDYAGFSNKLHVGDIVTRTIKLSAVGLSSSALPSLKAKIVKGLNNYPNKPIMRDEVTDAGVAGVVIQKEAFMANNAGDFILPGKMIRWFNTKTQRFEVANIKAKTLTFLPVLAKSPTPANTPKNKPATLAKTTKPNLSKQIVIQSKQTINPWLWLVGGLVALWLLTLFSWWYSKRKTKQGVKAQTFQEDNKKDIESPKTNAQPKTLRAAKLALKEACSEGSPVACKEALLCWAALNWQDKQFKSLADLATLVDNALQKAILQLERYLYHGEESNWAGKALWQAFSVQSKSAKSKKENPDDPLDPLYLHDDG